MATTKKAYIQPIEDAPSTSPTISNDTLAAAILELAKQLGAKQPEQSGMDSKFIDVLEALKPKPVDAITPEYLKEPRNRVPKFKRPVFQNAYEARPDGLSQDTIDKVDQLKPGKYLGGIVTVEHLGEGDNTKILLLYKNRSITERMNLQAHFSSFSDLVSKVHAEQTAR